MTIEGVEFLTYHIAEKNNYKYITSVFDDIAKEREYKKVLVLVNDINRLDLQEFVFGLDSVIICKDTDDEIKKLEKYYEIDWFEILEKRYNTNAYLSGNDLCDFNIDATHFANVFYMLDTERAYRTELYLMNKNADSIEVLCNRELLDVLKLLLPNANITPVDMIYIKERRWYS